MIVAFALSFSSVMSQQCMTPGNVTTGVITSTSVSITWEAASDSLYVIRYINIDVPGSLFHYKKTSNTSIVLTNLIPNTNYQYQIESFCTFRNKSDYSYPINFKTTAQKCNVPSGLTVTKITTHGATFKWTANGNNYALLYKVLSDTEWKYKTTTNNTITLTNLKSNTIYEWQVKSICNDGEERVVNYATGSLFNTLTNLCYNPSVIVPSNITNNSVTLLWDKSPDAFSYKIKYWATGKDSDYVHYYPKAGDLPLTDNTKTLTHLKSGVTYRVQIKTICKYTSEDIITGYSNVSSFKTLLITICVAPTELISSLVTRSSAKLSWTPCLISDKYIIKYYKKNIATGQNDPLVHYRQTSLVPFNLTGLQAGFTYGWMVKTYWSSTKSHQTEYSQEAILSTPKTSKKSISENNSNIDMLVYPNPSNGIFNLSVNNNNPYDIAIYNIQGKLIYSEKSNSGNTIKEINLRGMTSGIYLLRVLSNNKAETSKLIIQ